MKTIIYQATKTDQHRHPHLGTYIDIAGCFGLPVGPFPSAAIASTWIEENSELLKNLYSQAVPIIAGP